MAYHKERQGRQEYPEYYPAWLAMNRRCNNTKNREYKDYGGKGVKVCEAWHFLNDSGYLNYVNWIMTQPDWKKLKLGSVVARKEIEGDYAPENCEIVTRQVSSQRRSTADFSSELVVEVRRYVRKNPATTLKELRDLYGFGTEASWSRMLSGRGWDNINAIEPPVDLRACRREQKTTQTDQPICELA